MRRFFGIIFIAIVIIIIVVLLKCFFTEKGNEELYLYENEHLKKYYGVVIDNNSPPKKIDYNQTEKIADLPWTVLFLWSSNDERPSEAEVLRNSNGYIYSVCQYKKGYIVTTYSAGRMADRHYIVNIPSKKRFVKTIKKGVSIKKLWKIDFKLRVKEFIGNSSVHRFRDGTMAYVHYKKAADGEYHVDEYEFFKDELKLYKNMLRKDYKLISQ